MAMDRQIKKKPWLQRKLVYVIPGAILFILIIFQLAFADHGSKLKVDSGDITIGDVRSDLFQDYISVMGTVEPIVTIYLDATEGGRVEEIFNDEGTMLNKGDVILQLSNDNLLLEISNNEAQIARAINDLKAMRVNLENQRIDNKTRLVDLHYDLLQLKRLFNSNKQLFENGHISKEELEVSKENYERQKKHYELLKLKTEQDSAFMKERIEASEESVRRMQTNIRLIRKRLEKLKVISPVDGELAILNPEIGEVISYGTRIGTINILDSYKLNVEIDEHYISRVHKKLTAECDFANKKYTATVTKVYPEVEEGRFAVDMEFSNKVPEQIRIGQTSRIRLELGESKQAILIPRGSFYQSTGGQWIYVIDESGEFAVKRDIQIGKQNPGYYEIIDGLTPGEQVIVSGYSNFGDADKLVLK